MRKKHSIIALSFAALFALAAYLLWPPGAKAVSPLLVKFDGYGKGKAGERVAKFTLTNRGKLTLLRESHCRVEYEDEPNLVPSLHVAMPQSLLPGKAEAVAIPAPTGRGKWRAGFKVLKMDRRFEAVDWAGKHSLIPQSLHSRNYNNRTEVGYSDWIPD